jgi:hypothetical protein
MSFVYALIRAWSKNLMEIANLVLEYLKVLLNWPLLVLVLA